MPWDRFLSIAHQQKAFVNYSLLRKSTSVNESSTIQFLNTPQFPPPSSTTTDARPWRTVVGLVPHLGRRTIHLRLPAIVALGISRHRLHHVGFVITVDLLRRNHVRRQQRSLNAAWRTPHEELGLSFIHILLSSSLCMHGSEVQLCIPLCFFYYCKKYIL